ncbi:MAG: DUF2232 domain-containing protein [Lyngbya sp. HA4199-MV5]|jgi:uncharacterized protein YybS (DUF2232 family)|nr:DUF2232 domain-containing protein [Lyngbya sp. HA4199-MV5]
MTDSSEANPSEANPANRTDDAFDAASLGRDTAFDEASWREVEAALERPQTPADDRKPGEDRLFGQPHARGLPRTIDPSVPLIMVETAFLASAASLVFLVNYYFPIGPLLRLFFSIPIALTYLRWGSRAAWMGALVSGLLLSVLMGPARSILFVMPYGLMGVLFGVLWRRGAQWSVSITIGSLLGSLGFFFRVWLVSLLLGDDLWLYATTQTTDLLEWLFVKLGFLFQPGLELVQAAIVGMIVLNNVVYVFVVHLVAWLLLDRLGDPIPRPPRWVQVLMDYE